MTEWVIQTRQLKEDAAIGIVFPLFFSCGVIAISLFARDVHLDVDMVILGDIAFAPFNRLLIGGYDCGPVALWSALCLVIINGIFVVLFFKELKAALFDSDFAFVMGMAPTFLYYGLMAITSFTAVTAFDVVGSIVVVALMIAPPATARMLARNVEHMVGLSIIVALLSALLGYGAASYWQVSIAGSIAAASGLLFFIVVIFAPQKGIIAQCFVRVRQRKILAQKVLLNYLSSQYQVSASVQAITHDLGWQEYFVVRVIKTLHTQKRVQIYGDHVTLRSQ